MIKINYESDFKLTETTEQQRFADVPFEFVYSTNSGTYTASYDGTTYTNCKRNEDCSVTVIFNKHGLGVGKLKVRREFFVPDEDFPDGVYNIVSNETTDIMLVEGKTDNTDVEEEFNPPYIEGGGEVVAVEVVDNLDSDASDKALSARQGKVLKEMIPTDYITEIPDTLADKSYVDNAVLDKADKTEVEALGEEVATKQNELTLTVLDNGNIRIENLQGQTKDFMPATPSGDPMHYAYVSAGAEYNATDAIIQKTAPWETDEKWKKNEDGTYTHWEEPAIVEHLQGHWYLNGIGDITNEEMRDIYNITMPATCSSTWMHLFRSVPPFEKNPRTNIVHANLFSTGQVQSLSAAFYKTMMNIVRISGKNNINKYPIMNPKDLGHAFYQSNLTHIIGPLGLSQDSSNSIKYAGSFNNITHFFLHGIKSDIPIFDKSSLIEKRSLKYMINNATTTSTITITLHPDAYARLADDADIVAALEEKPLVTLVSA